jgi:hypothetical protein
MDLDKSVVKIELAGFYDDGYIPLDCVIVFD